MKPAGQDQDHHFPDEVTEAEREKEFSKVREQDLLLLSEDSILRILNLNILSPCHSKLSRSPAGSHSDQLLGDTPKVPKHPKKVLGGH